MFDREGSPGDTRETGEGDLPPRAPERRLPPAARRDVVDPDFRIRAQETDAVAVGRPARCGHEAGVRARATPRLGVRLRALEGQGRLARRRPAGDAGCAWVGYACDVAFDLSSCQRFFFSVLF